MGETDGESFAHIYIFNYEGSYGAAIAAQAHYRWAMIYTANFTLWRSERTSADLNLCHFTMLTRRIHDRRVDVISTANFTA